MEEKVEEGFNKAKAMMEKSDFERVLAKNEEVPLLVLEKARSQVEELEEVKIKIEPKVLEDDPHPVDLATFICQPDLDIKEDSESNEMEMLQWTNENEEKARTAMADQLQTKLVTEPVEEDEKVQTENKVLLPTRDSEVNSDQQKILLNESEMLNLPADNEAGLLNESQILSLPADSELQCKWKGCYQTYNSQRGLVRHIKMNHVKLQSGETFTCFWNNCQRKLKPYKNRRYLLLHMRIHTGKKPYKCVFQGCNKAFSQLGILKVHQRRHKRERPHHYDSQLLANLKNISMKLQCKWNGCCQTYDSQTAFVKHIEKNHVQLQSGNEFTCFWNNCPRKSKPYTWRCDLLLHMRIHSGEKPYKCTFKGCNKAYSRLVPLTIHQRGHTGERPYQCQFSNCAERFSTVYNKDNHERLHYNPEAYACQVTSCSKKYTSPGSLRNHMKIHTVDEQLEAKRKLVENKEKEGDFVLRQSSDNSNRNKHQRTHYDSIKCKWNGCCQTYDSQTALVKHIKKNHVQLQSSKEFTCFWNNCPRKSKPFACKSGLLIHMRIHSGEKPHICPFQGCDKAFSFSASLKNHQKSHRRMYSCQFSNCLKRFFHSSDMQKHERMHYNTLQCKWKGCYRTYDSQMALVKHIEKNHIQSQSGKEFTCFWNSCPRKSKPFNSKSRLLSHMMTHSGEKPYKCAFQGCNKAFSRLVRLTLHQRRHTGEKPYRCLFSNCFKRFSTVDDMKYHQKLHYNPESYACQVAGCSKKYIHPSSLRNHMKIHTVDKQLEAKWKLVQNKEKEGNFVVDKSSDSLDGDKHHKTHYDIFQSCNKTSSQCNNLKVQERRHTEEYTCRVTGCSKMYADLKSCQKHMENHMVDEELEVKQKSVKNEQMENDFIIYHL